MSNMRQKIGLLLVFALIVSVTGCNDMFVGVRVEGTIPAPVIRLDESLTLSQVSVEKVEYTENGDLKSTKYWGVVAKDKAQEKSFDVISYGHLPVGYQEYSSLRPLDLGFYSVQLKALHSVAGGAFLVLKTENGSLRVLTVEEPHNYKDEVIRCFQDFSYMESDVKENCLTREFRAAR